MILQPSLFDSRKKHKVSALVLMSHREITEFSLKLVVCVGVCVGGLGGGVWRREYKLSEFNRALSSRLEQRGALL